MKYFKIIIIIFVCFIDIILACDNISFARTVRENSSEHIFDIPIGFVGLGNMGLGMTEAIGKDGISVFGYDLNEKAVDAFDNLKVGGSSGSIAEMVSKMGNGKKIIWLMVPHGNPTDTVINEIKDLLKPGDIVIDGGNSNHIHHRNRAEILAEKGIILLGAGTSGGTASAGKMSMMIGGNQKAYQECLSVFRALGMEEGYDWFGEAGAGHFVKSVHNGIEYVFFQVLAEGVEVLASYFNWDPKRLTEVIKDLQDSNLSSWIMELALEVVRDSTFSTVAPHILGGSTGTWTQEDAKRLGIATPMLDATLKRRVDSKRITLRDYHLVPGDFAASFIALIRNKMGSHPYGKLSKEVTADMRHDILGIGSDEIDVDEKTFINTVLSAITYGWLMALKEGFEVIVASEYNIGIQKLANLSTVWQNGSVIRSKLIELAGDHFQRGENIKSTFNSMIKELGLNIAFVKQFGEIAKKLNIPTPVFSAILESKK